MKPNSRNKNANSKAKGKARLNKKNSRESKDVSSDLRKKPRVSKAAVKSHQANIKMLSNVERTRPRPSAELYKEKVISGKVLSKWKVMPKASQDHIIKVLDSIVSSVLYKTKDMDYIEVNTHLNNLKQRIISNLKSLKVPPVKDYKKLEQQVNILELTLAETNEQSDRLNTEIEKIEKLNKEKEKNLETLEIEVASAENNDQHLHPALQSSYVSQLDLPPLPNPVCYFTGKKLEDSNLQVQLELQSTSDNSQEISQYMNTMLQGWSVP